MSYLEGQYNEVNPTSSITAENFGNSLIEFPFAVGRPNVWYPSKSYIRVSATLYSGDGTARTQPKIRDGHAFVSNPCGSIFTEGYFQMGGNDVSKMNSFLPQASALKTRLLNSHSYLKSLGQLPYHKPDLMERILDVSSDTMATTGLSKSENEIYSLSDPAHFYDATVAPTGDALVGVHTNFQASDIGNTISIKGNSYTILTVADATNATIFPEATFGATPEFYGLRRNKTRSTQGRNKLYFMYQLPLGIFDLEDDKALGGGDYRLRLTVNPNWQTAMVETIKSQAVWKTDYTVLVDDVKLYYYSDKSSIPDDSYFLNLQEILVQNKPYSNSLQFSVPSSTFALSVFLQDSTAGVNTKSSVSAFKSLTNEDLPLNSIQITYGNITKTATSYQSNFDSTAGQPQINQLQQRYLECYENLSNSHLKTHGCETFEDYLKNGAIYHFDFSRDATNRSTEVQVLTQYKTAPVSTNNKLFVCAWYRNTVSYTTKQGSIVSVMTASI